MERGSNLACPTIRTTNDMPIVEPPSLTALGLVPFQINPHYTNYVQPNHQGETRDERLREFLVLNPLLRVVGLREGSMLSIEGRVLTLLDRTPSVCSKRAGPRAIFRREIRLSDHCSAVTDRRSDVGQEMKRRPA